MSRTQLFDQLLLLSSMLQEDQERELERIGLTPRRTHMLWLVHHSGALMQRDLAAAMEITPRHVTTLVDELIDSGLVQRGPHPDDRRAVLISLTRSGAELMESMERDHVRLSSRLTEGWDDSEVDDLRRRVEVIVARFTAVVDEAAQSRQERPA